MLSAAPAAAAETAEPLRVLHVYRTYFPETVGGLQEAVRQICHSTTALGVENRVFTLARGRSPSVLARPEARVFRFPLHLEVASTGLSATALGGFGRLARWADVVHYHFPWPFADALHALARVTTPAISTYHSDIIRQQGLLRVYAPLMHWFLRRMARVVATSPQYALSSPVLQRYADKVEAIPLALDPNTYPALDAARAAALCRRFGRGFFLFIGVLRYYKGFDVLLDAVRAGGLHLLLAGAGPEEVRVRRRLEAEGIDNVTLLGEVSDADKVALMHLARAVVLPSHLRSEAFGIALLEGAMFGKPLLSCEIGTGTSHINRDGETGLVVPPNDAVALRAALLRLDRDDALAHRLGRGARGRFDRLFAAGPMGAEYLRLYHEVAALASARPGRAPTGWRAPAAAAGSAIEGAWDGTIGR